MIEISMTTRGAGYSIGLALLLTLAACAGGLPGDSAPQQRQFTLTEEGGSRPTIATYPHDGTVYITWIETHGGASNLYLARLDPDAEHPTSPTRVNDIPGDAAPHDQAPPQVAVGPDGVVYLVWQNNTPVRGRRFPASELRFTYSTDRGESFHPAITVNEDTGPAPSSHTFHDLAITDDGVVFVSWIASLSDDDIGPEIRIAHSLDGGSSFEPPYLIDTEACPCCRTSLTIGEGGIPLVAWRKVFEGEIRDIVIARGETQTRESRVARVGNSPVRVHADRWQIDACPHAGPALLATRSATYLAWYTGAEGRAGLYYAISGDNGETFGPPAPILTAPTLPPSQLALASADADGVWIAWEDRRRPTSKIEIANLGEGMVQGRSLSIPGSSPALATAPRIVALAWLDGESVHLRIER